MNSVWRLIGLASTGSVVFPNGVVDSPEKPNIGDVKLARSDSPNPIFRIAPDTSLQQSYLDQSRLSLHSNFQSRGL